MAMTRFEFARKLAVRMGLVPPYVSGVEAAAALRAKGITRNSVDAFRGGDPINRAEAATMIVRSKGGDPATVQDGLQQAFDQGIFNTLGDGGAGFEASFFAHVVDNAFGPAAAPVAAPSGPAVDNVLNDPAILAAQKEQDARDAHTILKDMLNSFDLGDLSDKALQLLLDGASPESVMIQLRETQTFKDRFKGIQMLRDNGFPVISPGQYLTAEREMKQTLAAAGIPKGFYDEQDELASFIGNNVSSAEFADRVALAATAVKSVNPALRGQLTALYGIGSQNDGELIAYFLDPNRAVSVIEQRLQVEASGISAAGVRTIGTGFDRGTSEQLAQANVQQREIGDRLKGQAGLSSTQLLGEKQALSSSTLAKAEFGLSSDAMRTVQKLKVRRQESARRASGALATSGGVTGLGSAVTTV